MSGVWPAPDQLLHINLLDRGESSLPRTLLTAPPEKVLHSNHIKQHSRDISSEQTGFQPHCGAEPNPPPSSSTLHPDGMVPAGSSHLGPSQFMGRLSILRPHDQVRMGPLPKILQPDPQTK